MHLKSNIPKEAVAGKAGNRANEREAKINDSREVREAADIGKAAYVEAVGFDEGVEITGKVSEVLGEAQEQAADGAGGAAQTAKLNPAQIKEQLLKNIPPEKELRKQIEKEIKREIKYLHKKAMKMFKSPANANYYEMNNILKKIRELRGILVRLAKVAVDSLKSLWLRYVHGVMN